MHIYEYVLSNDLIMAMEDGIRRRKVRWIQQARFSEL